MQTKQETKVNFLCLRHSFGEKKNNHIDLYNTNQQRVVGLNENGQQIQQTEAVTAAAVAAAAVKGKIKLCLKDLSYRMDWGRELGLFENCQNETQIKDYVTWHCRIWGFIFMLMLI